MTILEAKKTIVQKIKAASKSPELDADVLLQALLAKDKTFVLMNRGFSLSGEQESRLREWTAARAKGLPVAYITGQKEFYGLNFFVDQSVLIPKPDTEILVARAVQLLSDRIDARSGNKDLGAKAAAQKCGGLEVCDMCAGSGCVAISVIRALADDERISVDKLPRWTLVDISASALAVAQKNASALLTPAQLEKVSFVQSNLFDALPKKFDAILSNPPYIPRKDARALLKDGRSEPLLALDGDIAFDGSPSGTSDGLEVFRRLAFQARSHLAPGGDFLCETGEYNAESAAEFLSRLGYGNVKIELDLEGQKRVVCATKGLAQGFKRSAGEQTIKAR